MKLIALGTLAGLLFIAAVLWFFIGTCVPENGMAARVMGLVFQLLGVTALIFFIKVYRNEPDISIEFRGMDEEDVPATGRPYLDTVALNVSRDLRGDDGPRYEPEHENGN